MGRIMVIRSLASAQPEVHDVSGRPIDWLETEFPSGFGVPAKVWRNGCPAGQEIFDAPLGENDDLLISLAPGDPASTAAWIYYAIAAAAAAAAVATYLLLPDIGDIAQDGARGSAVFSVNAQANRAQLGNVIPVPYGRVVRTPDYGAQSWRRFEANREVRHYLLCLGCGDQVVRSVRLGDTATDSLPPELVQWQSFKASEHRSQEGRIAAAFGTHENVVTSGEVDRQEIRSRLKFDGDAQVSGGTDGVITLRDEDLRAEVAVGDIMRFEFAPAFQDFSAEYTVTARNGDTATIAPRPQTSFNGKERVAVFGYDSVKTGPFVATPPGISASAYELDFEFPAGIYRAKDNGDFADLEVVVRVLMEPVDDDGQVIGPETGTDHIFRAASATPQRRTIRIETATGRYRFTCVRAEPGGFVYRARDGDSCSWTGLKAFIPPAAGDVMTYGPVTMLALKITGAEALSQSSKQQIFVETESVLPPVIPAAAAPSANPADIMADILGDSGHGANAPLLIDYDSLQAFSATQAGRPGFNGVFDRETTVWDAMTQVARIGQGSPVHTPDGIGVVRDMPRDKRRTVITLDTIAGDPPSIEIAWPGPTDPDGVEIEYASATNTAQPKYVTWPADAERPQRIPIKGCADDQLALDFAKFFWRERQVRATRLNFDTELIGRHFGRFDRIAVAVPDFNWGDGAVAEWSEAVPEGWRLHVSRDVPDGPLGVLLRHPDGEVSEVLAADGDGANALLFAAQPAVEIVYAAGQPTIVAWAPADAALTDMTVISLSPDRDTVGVEGALYDARLWEGLFE